MVYFSASGPLVLGGCSAAIANRVDLARLRLAGFDRLALGVGPVKALASGPTGALVVVFSPFLLGGRHDMVVVGADDLAQHVVGQIGQGLRVFYVHGAVALDDERLEFLGAHDSAEASACGVVAGIHHAGIGEKVLACRADGCDAGGDALEAVQDLGRGAGAKAPHHRAVLDLDLVILNVKVDRLVRLALDDDGIIASHLNLRAEHAAAVGVDNLIVGGVGGKEANRGAASQRHTGCGQRTDSVNDLRILAQRISAWGDLIVDDFVSQAHAADIVLIGCGRLGGDGSSREVHAQDLAGPAI